MRAETITLCLLREVEVEPFLRTLQKSDIEMVIHPICGSLQVTFRSNKPVTDLIDRIKERYPTFFIGEEKVEEALHREMIARGKKLALAESCTGGALAARIVFLPNASKFFLGSIVAYADSWKEHFLGVHRSTLTKEGVVSDHTVEEMVEGLFRESEADYAVAISGFVGIENGVVWLAIGKRGEKTDIGHLKMPTDRAGGIELAVQTAIGALWRRLVHNTPTFS